MTLTNQIKVSLHSYKKQGFKKQGFTYPDHRYIITEYGNGYTEYTEVTRIKSSVTISSGFESTIVVHPETIPMLIQELRRTYNQYKKEQKNV